MFKDGDQGFVELNFNIYRKNVHSANAFVFLQAFLCRLRSIAAHRDHFVRRLSVCLSGSHTFLVVTHIYVSQATHAFIGMLPLCYMNCRHGRNCRRRQFNAIFRGINCRQLAYIGAVDNLCRKCRQCHGSPPARIYASRKITGILTILSYKITSM